MFIHVMLLQYIRIICLSISCRRSKYTSKYFPSCSILPYWKVQFSNHGYGHTSVTPPYCSNESLRLAFPECSRNHQALSSFLLQSLHVNRVCFVFLLLLTVKCLFCIGDHVLALGVEGGVFPCKSLRPILTHSEEVSAKQFAAWSARSRMEIIPSLLWSVSLSRFSFVFVTDAY